MAKGTYDDPILCDGIFTKTINGVKKFFKINTGSSVDTSNFIKKTGDTVNGQLTISDNYYIQKTDDAHYIRINGCTRNDHGAGLLLFGKDWAEAKGYFDLVASDGVTNRQLIGKPNGSLSWEDREVERVNSTGEGYFRYESGIQICSFYGQITFKTTTLRKGYIWNYPVPFLSNPFFQDVVLCGGGDIDKILNTQIYSWNPSQMNIQCNDTLMNKTFWVYLFAMGYWK